MNGICYQVSSAPVTSCRSLTLFARWSCRSLRSLHSHSLRSDGKEREESGDRVEKGKTRPEKSERTEMEAE